MKQDSLIFRCFVITVPSVLFALGVGSCATTKTITVSASDKATVTAVPLASPDDKGDLLGETPVTVNLNQLDGKVVRLNAPGKLPLYWVVTDVAGDSTEAKFNLQENPLYRDKAGKSDAPIDRKTAMNRILRLLMQSYKALSAKDYALSKDLAKKAIDIDPELAAPLIIRGMALLKEGKVDEARAALSQAKALDPEDANIDQLLKVTK